MFKTINSKIKILGKAVFQTNGGGNTPSGVGKYWYSTSATAWNTQSNWYTDSSHLNQAASLPDASTDVILLGNVAPAVDLDAAYWIQPNSINSTATGISFTSQVSNSVTCDITGNATFLNTATFGN